jgi:hypothetical protein
MKHDPNREIIRGKNLNKDIQNHSLENQRKFGYL